jgi:hypothetical protein
MTSNVPRLRKAGVYGWAMSSPLLQARVVRGCQDERFDDKLVGLPLIESPRLEHDAV